MIFRINKQCKRELTTDNSQETGKIKILQTNDSVSTVGYDYLYRNRQENEQCQIVLGNSILCFRQRPIRRVRGDYC